MARSRLLNLDHPDDRLELRLIDLWRAASPEQERWEPRRFYSLGLISAACSIARTPSRGMEAAVHCDHTPAWRGSRMMRAEDICHGGSKERSARLNKPSKNRQIMIELKGERGEYPMEQSVFEHVGQKIDDTTHKATRAASAVADALDDTVIATRRAARDGADAAAELLYKTKRRLKRYPLETAAVTFAAGIAAGIAIGWMIGRKRSQP